MAQRRQEGFVNTLLVLEYIPFGLRQMLTETIGLYHEQARKKGLTLSVTIAPESPDMVHGDPHRLRQILTNLVGNALKFTETGNVAVFVRPDESHPGRVRIEVTDTGIGIPLHAQEKIFDSFSQADGSMTRKYGGTGLGLAIVKQLVGMMGGQLGLTSTPGQGTTFWFTISVDRSGSPETESQPHRSDEAPLAMATRQQPDI